MIIDVPQTDQIKELWRLWQDCFGDTEDFIRNFESTAFDRQRCRCVTVDGKVVAALYWLDCLWEEKKVAYLYAIATDKLHRGQGICHRLMENTHTHLESLGYVGALLVPSNGELFGFYKKMGYATCGYVSKYECQAQSRGIGVREINGEEYVLRRRALLPVGGVLQEGENIRLLGTMARLYCADGLLLAARIENGVVYGLELLGDSDLASQAVSALGCTKGIFRTVGEDIPFAMYRGFDTNVTQMPSYFGLAFD